MHAVEGIACRQLISHASDRNKTQWPNQNHHILPYPSHPSVAQSNPLLPIEIRPSGPTNTITSVSSICRAIESISADRNKTYLVALPTPSHDRILFVSHLIHHPKYLDSWLAHLKMLLWQLCLCFAQSMMGNMVAFGTEYNKTLLSPMQIVLVDDRCNDGSIDAMIKSCEDLLKSHKDVSFTLKDHRFEGIPRQQDTNTGDQRISISLDIIHPPRVGIAGALNHGLCYCRADLVARMDADDISTPQRLLSQFRFMRANPSFTAVGSSTVLFSATQTASGKRDNQSSNLILPDENLSQNTDSCRVLRPSLTISDPGFMAWAMWFTCSISHPSVVFQKDISYKSWEGTTNLYLVVKITTFGCAFSTEIVDQLCVSLFLGFGIESTIKVAPVLARQSKKTRRTRLVTGQWNVCFVPPMMIMVHWP